MVTKPADDEHIPNPKGRMSFDSVVIKTSKRP